MQFPLAPAVLFRACAAPGSSASHQGPTSCSAGPGRGLRRAVANRHPWAFGLCWCAALDVGGADFQFQLSTGLGTGEYVLTPPLALLPQLGETQLSPTFESPSHSF